MRSLYYRFSEYRAAAECLEIGRSWSEVAHKLRPAALKGRLVAPISATMRDEFRERVRG